MAVMMNRFTNLNWSSTSQSNEYLRIHQKRFVHIQHPTLPCYQMFTTRNLFICIYPGHGGSLWGQHTAGWILVCPGASVPSNRPLEKICEIQKMNMENKKININITERKCLLLILNMEFTLHRQRPTTCIFHHLQATRINFTTHHHAHKNVN